MSPTVTAKWHKGTGGFAGNEVQNLVPTVEPLPLAVAFDTYNQTITGDVTQTLCSRGDTGGNKHLVPALVAAPLAVRRLTPRECERLQGFPDDWTLITYRGKPAADGPRYKALGNSMATNVMRWIGLRIAAVEGGTHEVR